MDIPQQFLSEIIEEAKADEIGLWFIIGRVRDDIGVEEPALLQTATLQCVHEILVSGAVVAGYYKPDGSGVEGWDIEPEMSFLTLNTHGMNWPRTQPRRNRRIHWQRDLNGCSLTGSAGFLGLNTGTTAGRDGPVSRLITASTFFV